MKISIRWLLTAVLTSVTLGLGLSITALSFNRMRAASLAAGVQLMQVTGSEINDSFARFRLEVSAVLATSTGSRLAQARTLAERVTARSDLFTLLDANELVVGAFAGYPDGDSFTLRRVRESDLIPSYWRSHATYIILGSHITPAGTQQHYWLYDADEQLEFDGASPKNGYDPRTRPWFEAPLNRARFSPPFLSYGTNTLVFSLSQRSRVGSVFGINIALDGYSAMMRRHRPTPSALGAIITTTDNVVLALSDVSALDEAIRRNRGRPVVLEKLGSDPLLAALASSSKNVRRAATDYRDRNGQTWLCGFTPARDANGNFLGRAILLAVPEDELLAAARRQRNAALTLCLSIVFCMLPIAYLLSKILAEPLDVLRRDAVTLRNLDFSAQPPRHSIIAELDDFSETFRTMRQHVREHNDAVTRFIPRNFLETLGRRDITELQLGDHYQGVMTLLVADIRSFTTLSGTMSPEETFRFVNSYLSKMGPIVREHGGFIDKYIGDAIMAIFPGQPSDAVDAAIEMQRRLLHYNEERARAGHKPIAIGIGVHRGPLMLGTIGEEERFETAVISEVVKAANALEEMTKTFHAPILVSAEVAQSLDRSKYALRELGDGLLEDGTHHVTVYEVCLTSQPETSPRRTMV